MNPLPDQWTSSTNGQRTGPMPNTYAPLAQGQRPRFDQAPVIQRALRQEIPTSAHHDNPSGPQNFTYQQMPAARDQPTTFSSQVSSASNRFSPVNTHQSRAQNTVASSQAPSPRKPRVRSKNVKVYNGKGDQGLGPDFKRREHKYFVPGRVFAVLYAEPSQGSTDLTVTKYIVPGRYQSIIHQKLKYLIVFRNNRDSCTALGISTHQQKGFAANNVSPTDHGVIYSGSNGWQLSEAEVGKLGQPLKLAFSPIRVNADRPEIDKLDPLARIDYRKLYNIEHYCLAKNIGKVHDLDLTKFLQQALDFFMDGMPLGVTTPLTQPALDYNRMPTPAGPDALADRVSTLSMNAQPSRPGGQRRPDYHPDVYVLARRMQELRPDTPLPELLHLANIALQQKRDRQYGAE